LSGNYNEIPYLARGYVLIRERKEDVGRRRRKKRVPSIHIGPEGTRFRGNGTGRMGGG